MNLSDLPVDYGSHGVSSDFWREFCRFNFVCSFFFAQDSEVVSTVAVSVIGCRVRLSKSVFVVGFVSGVFLQEDQIQSSKFLIRYVEKRFPIPLKFLLKFVREMLVAPSVGFTK